MIQSSATVHLPHNEAVWFRDALKAAKWMADREGQPRLDMSDWPDLPEVEKIGRESGCAYTGQFTIDFSYADRDEGILNGIWIWLSDNDTLGLVANLVRHTYNRFDLNSNMAFTWSYDCGDPRNDEFGGGLTLVDRERVETIAVGEIADMLVNERREGHDFGPLLRKG